MLQIDEGSNGREIELPVGQTLEVCLGENPTAGFRWSLESRGEPACMFVKDFFEPIVGPPGQGGRHYWQFKTTQVGVGRIELSYRRSWEREKTPAQAFTLRVRVLK